MMVVLSEAAEQVCQINPEADVRSTKIFPPDDPMCISDSEAEDTRRPNPKLSGGESDLKAVRHSCRGEAQKDVDYSTRHHPQDKDIPGFRKRMTQSEEGNGAACTSSAKRRKMVGNGSSS
jgi:hypothetical protein